MEINGLKVKKVEAEKPNKRPPILFIHGSGGGAWNWDKYLGFFASIGYTGYALDLRGHYQSKPVEHFGKISFYDHLKDLSEVVRKLDHPILFGHSLGGLLVQKLAEAEAVPAAVLIAPAPPKGIWVVSSIDHMIRTIAHGREILKEKALRPSPDEAFRTTLNRLPPDERLPVYEKGWSQSGKLLSELVLHGIPVDASKIKTPMRVIVGGEDRQIPPRIARRVAGRYRADYKEYDGFGHVLIIEPGWDWIAKETAEWLDQTFAEN